MDSFKRVERKKAEKRIFHKNKLDYIKGGKGRK